MNIVLFSLLAWGFIFWYAHNHPIRGIPRRLRGGGGGDDAPSLPTRQSAEQIFSGSPRLQELDQMIRQYIGKSLNAPSEWGTQGDVLNRLLNYQPQLTYLQEPGEYGTLAEGLQKLLTYQPTTIQQPSEYGVTSAKLQELMGYNPPQFQYPMADIQKALEAQQAIQLQQYQNQIRPMLANQGQLDSTYYANLLGDFLKNQQAQTYGTTANLLTNQATQNYNLAQWLPQYQASIAQALQGIGGAKSNIEQYNTAIQNALPQYQSGILSQIGNLGTARLGVQQSNANLANQLAQWLPQWQASMAGQIGNLGTQKLGLDQTNLMLPLSTYIPGLQSLFNSASGVADTTYQDALRQYQADMDEYNQMVADKSAKWQTLGSLPGGGFANFFVPSQYQGDVLAGNMDLLKTAVSMYAGGASGGFGGASSGGGGMNFNVPQADMPSTFNTNFKMPSMTNYFNQNYSGYGF